MGERGGKAVDVPDPKLAREMAALVREKKPDLGNLAEYLDGLAEFLDSARGGAIIPDARPGDQITVTRRMEFTAPERATAPDSPEAPCG